MTRHRFLAALFDSLWTRYRARLEYVRRYEALLARHGAAFVNDHIAFRTIACQEPMLGLFMTARIFEALGYVPAACYEFPEKHLSSVHYRHPDPRLPKLFITQLKAWELSRKAQRIIAASAGTHRPPLDGAALAALRDLEAASAAKRAALLKALTRHFAELPWDIPQRRDVLALDRESQFGAWVLLNGYDVNHFTASIDSHGVPALDDVEKVQAALTAEGVPMKKAIEGARGSGLRQTATEAVVGPVKVKDGTRAVTMPWTYAYFELAERPLVKDPATGRRRRFEGFLGAQATNLFEMTRRSG